MITITAANIVVGDNRRNCVILTQFLLVRFKQGLGQARPNKITWKTRKSLKSEVPDGQEIFKN